MPIASPFEIGKAVDLSAPINVIPNRWGVIQQLGLFQDEFKAQKTVMLSRTAEADVLVTDRNWDERNNTIKGVQRDVIALPIPHYPVDDAITPNDIDGVIDFDSLLNGGNTLETIPQLMARKMQRIRAAHANTLEFARAALLKDGTVYAPNGTVNINFYDEFGITREVVPLALGTLTTSPLAAVNDALALVQDGIQSGQVITNFVALCSPSFFNALVTHPLVVDSFSGFSQPQSAGVLNQRLNTTLGLDARYRAFEYGGITFIEVRGTIGGQAYVEDGEAYLFPLGTDMFRTFYAPANRLSTVNTIANSVYLFQYVNQKDDIIELMSESNFLNAMVRPQSVVTLTVA